MPQADPLRQRLLAILAAHAAGYSASMAIDPRATVQALDEARDVFRRHVTALEGWVIDTAGDSVLVAFGSAGAALQAALAIQAGLARRLPFRIGVHIGDVIEKHDGSVYGDGVNIAARLQALAEPGGICLSQAVHGIVAGQRGAPVFDDIGEHRVKNVPWPVHAWRVHAAGVGAGWSFGTAPRFELQPRERRLLVDGADARLGARALDLLIALVERAGQLVTRNELIDRIWPGLVVEENNLNVQISGLRKVLGAECIATVPGGGYRFAAQVDRSSGGDTVPVTAPPPAATGPAPSTPLPAPPTTLIGRADDLASVQAALRRPGCITLAGSAGVGKTSLARAVAAVWPAGALWVDLAALTDGAQVLAALARGLDLPLPDDGSAAPLVKALGARLLVLDNAEHLLDAAAALVSALQQAAPGLHLLVTSQSPLSLAHERVHRIDPLSVESALVLLTERARAADHRFAATADAQPLLHEICHRLDRLPLALEMAASRMPALGVKGVHDALASRLALLKTGYRDAAGRHRTLRAALDWSYGLLGADEQRLFRALGVFSGGFTLDLAQHVAGSGAQDRWSVIDHLSVLVERSLVATDRHDPPRYALLETMREYALDRLVAAGEEPASRRRLALALRDLFGAAQADVRQRDTALAEHANARESVTWAVAHDPALAVPLADAISRAATFVSWRNEACVWLESCAAVEGDPRVAAADRAAWWEERARQRVMNRDPSACQVGYRALELHRALGDPTGMFQSIIAIVRGSTVPGPDLPALCDELESLAAQHPEWPLRRRLALAGALAHACTLRGDHEGRLAQRLRERELACAGGLPLLADAADSNVVFALQALGRHEDALAHATALLDRIGSQETLNVAYAWLGRMTGLVSLQRWNELGAETPRALAVLRRFGLPQLSNLMAWASVSQGRPRAAALLIGYTHQAYAAAGRGMDAECVRQLAGAEAGARAVLGAAEFERLVQEGRTFDDATAERVFVAAEDAR